MKLRHHFIFVRGLTRLSITIKTIINGCHRNRFVFSDNLKLDHGKIGHLRLLYRVCSFHTFFSCKYHLYHQKTSFVNFFRQKVVLVASYVCLASRGRQMWYSCNKITDSFYDEDYEGYSSNEGSLFIWGMFDNQLWSHKRRKTSPDHGSQNIYTRRRRKKTTNKKQQNAKKYNSTHQNTFHMNKNNEQ